MRYPESCGHIREVLIHGNYLAQKDIEICLCFDVESLAGRPEINAMREPQPGVPGMARNHPGIYLLTDAGGKIARSSPIPIMPFRRIAVSRTDHICLMAKYNEWMNTRLYEAAMRLSDEEIAANRNAFFGSILGILNHLAVGDTIWLKRFATHPANYSALEPVRNLPIPERLDQPLYSDVQSLLNYRRSLDQIITEWAHSIKDHDLNHLLHYANTKGVAADKNFFSLAMHFFNHQTHHRGQATTLLSQAGVAVGVTDLLVLIPNETVV